ncbi:MAG: hypothetical protein EOM64_10630 [Erysipelotrichia bacterium]|nr:hypothetical protein [Erysipelotrichia bacterium]
MKSKFQKRIIIQRNNQGNGCIRSGKETVSDKSSVAVEEHPPAFEIGIRKTISSLAEIIDHEAVRSFMDAVLDECGIGSVIYEPDGNILCGSRKCRSCSMCASLFGKDYQCSDFVFDQLFDHHPDIIFTGKCTRGLNMISIPISVCGEYVAVLRAGPFILSDKDAARKGAVSTNTDAHTACIVTGLLNVAPVLSMENLRIISNTFVSMTKSYSQVLYYTRILTAQKKQAGLKTRIPPIWKHFQEALK